MREIQTEDVIVIGAGPAGLSLAYCLAHRGVSPLLLEAGDVAGFSWANMPQNISLLSPWKVNHLPGTRPVLSDQHALHSCHDFSAYLRRYAEQHRLRVRPNAKVETLRKIRGGFELQTSVGKLRARTVVSATGYFAKPRWPKYQGMERTKIRQLHVHDFKSAAQSHAELAAAGLADSEPRVSRPRVLVVGKRISAGQTLAELHDAEVDFEVVLCRRGPVSFAPPPWLLKLSFWLFFSWEDRQVELDPFGLDDTFPPMEGGREKAILTSGKVRQVPDIARFHSHEIEFVDNRREPFDLVIYNTGFLPALDHLGAITTPLPSTGLPPMQDMQSTEAPGLFFLGMDKQRTFRSRYLRGIREDAEALAEIVAARIDRQRGDRQRGDRQRGDRPGSAA